MSRSPQSRRMRSLAQAAAIGATGAGMGVGGERAAQASPLWNVKLLARLAGSSDPFSSSLQVTLGESVEYQLVGNMASVGTSNANVAVGTITSLTAGLDGGNNFKID